jgi:hydroxymethylbilane synthase
MAEVLRVGSRASRLALVQTEWVVARLREAWPDLEVRVEKIRTAGDRDRATPLAAAPAELGVGVFVKELEQTLLDGRIDLAVHSMKDVPTRVPEGLEVEASVPRRADPRDCLLTSAGQSLEGLPRGAKVGTSSPRRRAMLLAARADLRFTDLRGNVETRLAKLEAGRCDATVLARAGLERLGLVDARAWTLEPSVVLPAAGQGALGLEFRAGDERVRGLVGAVDDAASRAAIVAERALVRRLGAGCRTPLGVLGTVDGAGRLALEAYLVSAGGRASLRERAEGSADEAPQVGVRLAETLLGAGAARWIERGNAAADA